MSTGHLVKRVRKITGASQARFGEVLGVSAPQVSRYENERDRVPEIVMSQLSLFSKSLTEAHPDRELVLENAWDRYFCGSPQSTNNLPKKLTNQQIDEVLKPYFQSLPESALVSTINRAKVRKIGAELLKTLRQIAGIKQKELGEIIQVPKTQISSYECTRYRVSLPVLAKLLAFSQKLSEKSPELKAKVDLAWQRFLENIPSENLDTKDARWKKRVIALTTQQKELDRFESLMKADFDQFVSEEKEKYRDKETKIIHFRVPKEIYYELLYESRVQKISLSEMARRRLGIDPQTEPIEQNEQLDIKNPVVAPVPIATGNGGSNGGGNDDDDDDDEIRKPGWVLSTLMGLAGLLFFGNRKEKIEMKKLIDK